MLIPLTVLCDECPWEVDRKLRYVEKIVRGKVVQRIRAFRRGGVLHVSQEDTETLRTELARRPLTSDEKELNARQQTYRALAQRAHGRGATVRQEWSDVLLGTVHVDFARQCA